MPPIRKRRAKPSADQEIVVVNASSHPLRDLYHQLLRAPWWVDILALSGTFLGANLLFAIGFSIVGGIKEARSFGDLFFFSVQTMGTIGYGAMYPVSLGAHVLVTLESLTQIFLLAVTTGLVFAKFSVPRARVRFAKHPVIAPFDGRPTLMFRIGNERDSRLIEAIIRVVVMRTETTREGVTIYRMRDLKLERERSPALSRSWTVMHKIDESSPLHGATPERLAADEVELFLTLTGTDEISAQAQHAQKRYDHSEIRFGARHADMLSARDDGRLTLDMARFHELIDTAPVEGFPYGDAPVDDRHQKNS
jgi:inward rectifier potassium channel